jgi:hypothetical protein
MASPEYRNGDLAAQPKVRAFYIETYGTAPVGVAPLGPGEASANPFGRRE